MEILQLKDSEQFAIRLLKQALIVYRLTNGLERLGFHSKAEYDLEIADMVFELMGYVREENSDWFIDCYIEYLAGLDIVKLSDVDFLDSAAKNLYYRLSMAQRTTQMFPD